MADTTNQEQAGRSELHDARPRREGHGQGEVRRGLPRRGHAVRKLLLSPMPHARVTSIDASAALAMPGVKAHPHRRRSAGGRRPAPTSAKTSSAIAHHRARPHQRADVRRRADSRGGGRRRTDGGRGDREDRRSSSSRCRSSVDPIESLRPGSPNARTHRQRVDASAPPPAPPRRRTRRSAAPPPRPEVQELKWTEADFAAAPDGQLPMGKHTTSGRTATSTPASRRRRSCSIETWVGQNTSHQALEPRSAMAYWQNGKLYLHAGTQSTVQTVPSIARWVGIDQKDVVLISEYTGGGFGSKDPRLHRDGDSGAAVEEGERAGDDAHRPRRRALHRPRASGVALAAPRSASTRKAASPRSTCSSWSKTVPTIRWATTDRPATSSRCSISRRRCGGAAWRCSPTRRRAARSAQPGGMQGIAIMEPILAEGRAEARRRSGGDSRDQRAGRQSEVRSRRTPAVNAHT